MIQVGQDGLGKWAWMMFDVRGRRVGSGDSFRTAAEAINSATNAFISAKERGELNLPARPDFSFPDAR